MHCEVFMLTSVIACRAEELIILCCGWTVTRKVKTFVMR